MLGDNHNRTYVKCERLPDEHNPRLFKHVKDALRRQTRGCDDTVHDESGQIVPCGSRRIMETIRFLEGVEASAVTGQLGVLRQEPQSA
jgi:hypothetical protein